VREFLDREKELSDREMYFLAEALAAVADGLFRIALQAILDAHEPERSFAPNVKVPPEGFKGTSPEGLRKALKHSESCATQERPRFR